MQPKTQTATLSRQALAVLQAVKTRHHLDPVSTDAHRDSAFCGLKSLSTVFASAERAVAPVIGHDLPLRPSLLINSTFEQAQAAYRVHAERVNGAVRESESMAPAHYEHIRSRQRG